MIRKSATCASGISYPNLWLRPIAFHLLERAMAIALDRYIETSPDVRGGRPYIADTRLTVADIVLMYLRLGQSLEQIAGKYDLPLAAVYAAIAYYYDHQAEIDHTITAD